MPYVQPHYLATPLFAAREGEGVVLSSGKLGGAEWQAPPDGTALRSSRPELSRSKRQTRESFSALKHIKEKPRPACHI